MFKFNGVKRITNEGNDRDLWKSGYTLQYTYPWYLNLNGKERKRKKTHNKDKIS
jgi:hypothetical protein